MVTTLFIGLCLAAAVVAFIGLVIFLRTAFQGEPATDDVWRPAFIQGAPLREWAADVAENFTAARLRSEDVSRAARNITAELGAHVTQAMLPSARSSDWERVVPCDGERPATMGVTPLEAIALASELRVRLSPREQRSVLETARSNVARLMAQPADRPPRNLPCPMRAASRICNAYSVRPLACRARHAMAVATAIGARGVAADHAPTVLEGAIAGFTRALQASGRDANRYELNGALVAAFETPDAAMRWAGGEAIFASCVCVA